MTKVAVIGSNCFTGTHIVEALLTAGSCDVLGVSRSNEPAAPFMPYAACDRSRFAFHRIDIVRDMTRLTDLLDREQPEIVIFVAALSEVALSNDRPVEYYDINTAAVVRLCEYLRGRDWFRRYVHISSAEIFGRCTEPAHEYAPFNPSTPYAVSKAAADMHLGVLARNAGFPATIVRSTNVYGAGQQLFKIIPRSVIYIRQGHTIELHGGGVAKKSFIHIRDVVRGVMSILARDASGPFHFSMASERSVAEIVRLVCEQMNVSFADVTRPVGERLGQDARYWLDCPRANRELDWTPRVELTAGIAEVIQWIDQHWQEIQAQPLEYQHRA